MQRISPTLKKDKKIITIAAGCFWGVEHIYKKHFTVTDLKVGYANGDPNQPAPNYRAVCSGNTGFAEALQMSYDPSKLSFKELVSFFFRMHDPTQLNQQGPDIGTQYRSAIFVNDEEEMKIANEEKEIAQKKWYPNHRIMTKIEYLQNFYDAEDYHQRYLIKNPFGYECPSHFVRTEPKK